MLCWFLPYNNVYQLKIYTCPLPLEPPSSPTPSHVSWLSRSTRLSSLCCPATSHQLAILHMIYVHMFQCYCLNAFHFSQRPTALPCLCVECQADRKKDVWPVGSSAWGAQSQSGRCHQGVTDGALEFLHFSLSKKIQAPVKSTQT